MDKRQSIFVFLISAVVAVCNASAEENDVIYAQIKLPEQPTHIIIQAELAGTDSFFMFDTGAGVSLVDVAQKSKMVADLGTQDVSASGSAKMLPMNMFIGPPLKFQHLRAEAPKFALGDLKTQSAYLGYPLVGIFGNDQMVDKKVFISYDTLLVTIHRGPWRMSSPEVVRERIETGGGAPCMSAVLLGYSSTFLLDSGYNGTISLEEKVFKSLVDDGAIEVSKIPARSATISDPKQAAKQGWFTKGKLMGKSLVGVSVRSTPDNVSMLGLEWLYAFNIEIDLAAGELRYEARKNVRPPPDISQMFGAILSFNNTGARVERLRPGGGAAERGGLRPGDVIVKFASVDPKEMNLRTIGEAVAASEGKHLLVKFQRSGDASTLEARLRIPPLISSWNFAGRDAGNGK